MENQRAQISIDWIRNELIKQYNRATTSTADDVDLLAINLFATIVQQNETSMAYEATKIILRKFNSTNDDEVLLALNVLEECMSKCGPKFHSEVGKFRFLNELIRLVSPVHDGNKTSKKIKDKILDLLLLWTHNYPHEKKIKEAYDMLLKRGVVHDYAKAGVVQKAKEKPREGDQVQTELASKLKKLLQSKRTEDYQAANLLIQNMFKENERRVEVHERRKLELKEIMSNASLLDDMLNAFDQGGQPSEDELTTMKFLFEACRKLQSTISIILGDVNDLDCLTDAVETNDFMIDVFKKYQRLVTNKPANSELITTATNNTALNRPSTMDELHDIFTSSGSCQANQASQVTNLANITPLAPTPIHPSTESNGFNDEMLKSFLDIVDPTNASSSPSPFDVMSQPISPNEGSVASTSKTAIIHQSPTAATSAAKPIPNKTKFENFDTQLNELISGLKSNLAKEAESPEDDDKPMLISEVDDVNELKTPSAQGDAVNVPFAVQQDAEQMITSNVEATTIDAITPHNNHTQSKRLTEIVVDLNKIQPHDEHLPRCILDDKAGLKVVLNYAKDRPQDAVAVLVITTTNQSSSPISNLQLEASVSKPCKLHLQTPSGNQLPGIKPFRPATDDITQVLLISNPEHKALKLVCIISYILGDDPDPVKEFLEITDLPDLFT